MEPILQFISLLEIKLFLGSCDDVSTLHATHLMELPQKELAVGGWMTEECSTNLIQILVKELGYNNCQRMGHNCCNSVVHCDVNSWSYLKKSWVM